MTWHEDANSRAVLSAILRGATGVEAVAAGTGLETDSVRIAVSRLVADGRIAAEGERLLARAPAEHLRAVLDEQLLQISSASDEIRKSLTSLPHLLNDWTIGRRVSGGGYPVEVLRGPHVLQQLWGGRFAWETPGKIRVAASGLDLIESFRIPDVPAADSFMSEHELDVRCLLPGALLADPEAERTRVLLAPATQIRVVPELRTWFVLHDDTLALPLVTGQQTFECVLLVTAPPVARLAADYFDSLWKRAQPIPVVERDWQPLLSLMAEGATIESAARMLGISERTARRRIASAMDHYGADGLFALGMAWQEEQGIR